MDAIILCGGKGSRLASVVSNVPKPMASIRGRPFLDYVLSALLEPGLISRIIFATGHLGQNIEQYYGDKVKGIPAFFSSEERPLGTGGATLFAMRRFDVRDGFVLLNGDTYVSVDIESMAKYGLANPDSIVLSTAVVKDSARFGSLLAVGENIVALSEKPSTETRGLINSGWYFIGPSALKSWMMELGPLSLELDVLPVLIKNGKVKWFQSKGGFLDIGIPTSYEFARTAWDPAPEVVGSGLGITPCKGS